MTQLPSMIPLIPMPAKSRMEMRMTNPVDPAAIPPKGLRGAATSLPHGDRQMDLQTLGTAAAGGAATWLGQWLIRRLIIMPRSKPMTVRELKSLLAEVDGERNRRIEDVLQMVEQMRSEQERLRGTVDGLYRRINEIAAASGCGD